MSAFEISPPVPKHHKRFEAVWRSVMIHLAFYVCSFFCFHVKCCAPHGGEDGTSNNPSQGKVWGLFPGIHRVSLSKKLKQYSPEWTSEWDFCPYNQPGIFGPTGSLHNLMDWCYPTLPDPPTVRHTLWCLENQKVYITYTLLEPLNLNLLYCRTAARQGSEKWPGTFGEHDTLGQFLRSENHIKKTLLCAIR